VLKIFHQLKSDKILILTFTFLFIGT